MSRPGERPDSRGNEPRINQAIRAPKVRLIDAEGETVGILSLRDALDQATLAGLDLVEVSPNAVPPVCKLLNYGRFCYEQKKKRTEAKKNQKIVELKEVQMRPNINQNDFDVKCRAIERFLKDGNKIRVVLRFRGREVMHKETGEVLLERVRTLFEEEAKVENVPRLEGKSIVMILSPK